MESIIYEYFFKELERLLSTNPLRRNNTKEFLAPTNCSNTPMETGLKSEMFQ